MNECFKEAIGSLALVDELLHSYDYSKDSFIYGMERINARRKLTDIFRQFPEMEDKIDHVIDRIDGITDDSELEKEYQVLGHRLIQATLERFVQCECGKQVVPAKSAIIKLTGIRPGGGKCGR